MKEQDLRILRKLAEDKDNVTYSKHSLRQMITRGYKTSDVQCILSSDTNQLIETQSPCLVKGPKFHQDERYIISDPNFQPETAVVISMDFSNPASIKIIVITVEPVLEKIWDKNNLHNPWLVRKSTMT